MSIRAFLVAAVVACLTFPAAAAVRIKDIASLNGQRSSQLIGYGLVVGLLGTGDTLRNVPFTEQSIQSMIDRFGINARGASLRNRNVAAVIVTSELPSGADAGERIDVTVSALGDATSLVGGTLLLTRLGGADGQPVATAQGPVSVTGFDVQGQASSESQGVPTAGRIANGAMVDTSAPAPIDELRMTLELRNPDYATAVRMIDAINQFSRTQFHKDIAFERGQRSVEVFRPPTISQTRLMAEIGELTVDPDTVARVVVDARTGTVVIGQDVQISTVAVTHGTLNVKISETPQVSQPGPRSQGTTTVTPKTKIEVDQAGGQVAVIGGSSLRALVAGLNRLGVKPSGIIAILQAIKSAGALQADLIAQ